MTHWLKINNSGTLKQLAHRVKAINPSTYRPKPHTCAGMCAFWPLLHFRTILPPFRRAGDPPQSRRGFSTRAGRAGRGPDGGQRVTTVDGWWLDEDFKTLDIASCLRIGENEIVYCFDYRPDMELEPIYVIGAFGVSLLKPGLEHWHQENYVLTEAPAKLAAGDWLDQGLPQYGDGVKYAVDVDMPAGAAGIRLDLPQLACTAAAVHVGADCIPMVWPPYRTFIPAEAIRKAGGRIWVEILGGRKAVLGTAFSSPEPSRFGLLGAPTVRIVSGR